MLTSLYNSEPKGNILIVIFIYVATSESTLEDGHLDTLNSQMHPLFQILDTEPGWSNNSRAEGAAEGEAQLY